jgi:hypothetical protein
MPAEVLRSGGTELWAELEARLRDWADRVDVSTMSQLDIEFNIDVLSSAIADGEETEDEWLRVRELMIRLTFLCEQLPAAHPFRQGEYCD